MSYKVVAISPFRKKARKLIKKFPSLKEELAEIGKRLAHNPVVGASLGNNCYKIRVAIASKRKGSSGGARIITHLHVAQDTIFLLSIYDKADQEAISESQLKALLEHIQ